MENWIPIIGFEGLYEVSDQSRVRGLKQHACVLKPGNKHGYMIVKLFKKGESKHYSIHRLVAIHFIPNPENKGFVNHINGIKSDNRIENLEWVTFQENMDHAVKSGLIKKGKRYKSAA